MNLHDLFNVNLQAYAMEWQMIIKENVWFLICHVALQAYSI